MKNNYVIIICIFICMNSCRMPADAKGEINIIKRLKTINTGGNCLDLDVDIEQGILVAAANYNGIFIYDIESNENGIVSEIEKEPIHFGPDEMNSTIGDNRAQHTILSRTHKIAFVVDEYDNIYLFNYALDQDIVPTSLDVICFGETWTSLAIDDQNEKIGIFSLLKHNRAELKPYCIDSLTYVNNKNYINQSGINCNDFKDLHLEEFVDEYECERIANGGCSDTTHHNLDVCIENGKIWSKNIWKHPGCLDAVFDEFSTSLVWNKLILNENTNTSFENITDCEYIMNQGVIADQIYFSDSLLTLSYSELGVRVFKQASNNTCIAEIGGSIEAVNLETVLYCNETYLDTYSSEIDYKSCCENEICTSGMGNCSWFPNGFNGQYASTGGIIPRIVLEFDTPGEVEALYSFGNTLFAGLSHGNGYMIAVLNDDGSVSGPNQFAVGYTIKGIHQDNSLLALAAGNDGILLYRWNGTDVSFMGKIATSYANNVKVSNDIIFAATKDGIDIIQIDF